MSRDAIERQLQREEDRLSRAYRDGQISIEEYNAEMRALQREARDAAREEMEREIDRVRADWGRW